MTGGRAAPAAFAALLAAAGAWVGVQALQIGEAGGYSPVGPRFFPVLVSVALVVAGLAVLLGALRAPMDGPSDGQAAHAPHRAALVWLSAAMLLGALLIERAGFVAAMALAFWVASRAFTARVGESALRDAVVAIVVALAVHLFFSRVLGLRLPAGWLGF